MVAAVRAGESLGKVARRFRVCPSTVLTWVRRAAALRLDRVDWDNRSRAPHHTRRTPAAIEDRILAMRQTLRTESALGEFGADAVRNALLALGETAVPSLRTVERIFERRGATDHTHRTRRPAPPRGWYLPEVAQGLAEVDCFDVIEGLVITGGPQLEVLTVISLWGGLPGAWPQQAVVGSVVVDALREHWLKVGLPHYAQFDNDSRFVGPPKGIDVLSLVMRACLAWGVVPVFSIPREHGPQNVVESFNDRWQRAVWQRFQHASLQGLRECSDRFLEATHTKRVARIEAAPPRRLWSGAALDVQAPPQGRVVLLRRASALSEVTVLGHTLRLDSAWPHRLVRAEVDLTEGVVRCYALRRHEPSEQPCLLLAPFVPPARKFRGGRPRRR